MLRSIGNRDVTKFGLGRLKPPPPNDVAALKLGWESVFLHCCFGHHAVVIEGYFFAVFCIVDIIVQTILTCRNALQQDGRGYTSVFTIEPLGPCCMQHRPVWPKSFSFWEVRPPKSHQSFAHGPHWHTRGDFRSSNPPVPLAAWPWLVPRMHSIGTLVF